MVDHELDELRREFLGEAREKAVEMQTLSSAEDLAPALERIAYLAHQLKGSGGSYGYPSISDGAAELEKAVEGAGGSPGAEATAAIRGHVETLLAEIDRGAAAL